MTNNGSAIAILPSGKRCFVYGALPEETVEIDIIEDYARYSVAITRQITKQNPLRTQPRDIETYQATSPWQIMPADYEDGVKCQLIKEALKFGKVDFALDDVDFVETLPNSLPEYHYRNKYIYHFSDSEYLFAAIDRGSHNKIVGANFSLPNDTLNGFANDLLEILRDIQLFAPKSLESLLVRVNRDGEHLMRLCVENGVALPKKEELHKVLSPFNIEIVGMNQRTVYRNGINELTDYLLIGGAKCEFTYGIDSFWQINSLAFECALSKIADSIAATEEHIVNLVDFYSGIGSIGLSVLVLNDNIQSLKLVEIDQNSTKYANINAKKIQKAHKMADIKVIKSDAKRALEHIKSESIVILDPPRAGLDKNVTAQINNEKPKKIYYLSCNPETFARDLARLQNNYRIESITGYNFFPKTPHTEVLGILNAK